MMADGLVVQFHIHHRRTGVTSCIENILPELCKYYTVVWYGNNLNTDLPNLNLINLIRTIKKYNKLNAKIIVHTHRNNELLIALLLRVLGSEFYLVATRHSSTKASWFTRLLYNLADSVISLNKLASDHMYMETSIIPHGLNIDHFPMNRQAPEKLGIKSKRIIGVVGRIRELKGQKDLVDAALTVLKENPDWGLVILGQAKKQDKKYIADIKSTIAKENMDDRVYFVGEVLDPRPYYNIFDIVVVASYTEGSSMVPLEAMATGSAVIATENVGTNSLIVEEGINGYLYTAGDVEQLREKLDVLTSDQDMLTLCQKNARKSIEDKWSVVHEVNSIMQVYERS